MMGFQSECCKLWQTCPDGVHDDAACRAIEFLV